jgi:hypothetical protein
MEEDYVMELGELDSGRAERKKARRKGKGKGKAGAEDAEDDWGD